jgi:hypothetical protein
MGLVQTVAHCLQGLPLHSKKAMPIEWAKYSTASVVIQIIKDQNPRPLHDIIMSNYYSERRNARRGLFYDSSPLRVGRQSIENRLLHFTQIKEPWNKKGSKMTNNRIRVMLKKTFFSHNAITGSVCDA